MSDIDIAGPVAFLKSSSSAVFFSKTTAQAGVFKAEAKGTALPIKKLQNLLK